MNPQAVKDAQIKEHVQEEHGNGGREVSVMKRPNGFQNDAVDVGIQGVEDMQLCQPEVCKVPDPRFPLPIVLDVDQ